MFDIATSCNVIKHSSHKYFTSHSLFFILGLLQEKKIHSTIAAKAIQQAVQQY